MAKQTRLDTIRVAASPASWGPNLPAAAIFRIHKRHSLFLTHKRHYMAAIAQTDQDHFLCSLRVGHMMLSQTLSERNQTQPLSIPTIALRPGKAQSHSIFDITNNSFCCSQRKSKKPLAQCGLKQSFQLAAASAGRSFSATGRKGGVPIDVMAEN